jgi:hypothetical protein
MLKNKFILISIVIIILLNTAIYIKTVNHGFVNIDDPAYIANNPFIKDIDGDSIKKMFTEHYFANYQPLVLLSYAVEYKYYKLNASGYHITNIVLHTINSILVLLLIYTITKSSWISLFIALLFSLHPMQVESVAWVSERKGLMCAFFYLLSFMAYIRFSRKRKISFYFLSIVLFLLSLLSKPMSVTLPLILILFDYYQDNKLSMATVIEKAPYFMLSAAASVVTIMVQRAVGAMQLEKTTFFFKNILYSFYRVGFYIKKLLLPIKLSSYYTPVHLSFSYTSMEFIAIILAIVVIIVYLVNFKRINKEFNFGVFFFLVSLIPILKIVHLEGPFAADRYMYVPMIGFFFAMAALIKYFLVDRKGLKKTALIVAAAYIICLGTLTYARCNVWKNSYTLWTNVLKTQKDSPMALLGIGNFYLKERKEPVKARKYYTPVLKNEDKRRLALYFTGASYLQEYNFKEAKKYFIQLNKEFPNHEFGDVDNFLKVIKDL